MENYIFEEKNLLLNHAWRYFELHANQRIALFRFYIIFSTLFATGLCYLFIRFPYDRIIHELLIIAISIMFIILTNIFSRLDKRNCELIHFSEDALKILESEVPFYSKLKIFTEEESSKQMSHRQCFTIIYGVSYGFAIFSIIAAIFSVFYYSIIPHIYSNCAYGIIH